MIKKLLKKLQHTVYRFLNPETHEMIERFLGRFDRQLRIEYTSKVGEFIVQQGDIYFADLGRNIGSEMAKNRPCIIISHKKMNYGDGVLVAPMKTYRGKKYRKGHVLLPKNEDIGILRDNIIDVSQMRYISKKRISSGKIGQIDQEMMSRIENKILYIFHIQKK